MKQEVYCIDGCKICAWFGCPKSNLEELQRIMLQVIRNKFDGSSLYSQKLKMIMITNHRSVRNVENLLNTDGD